MFETPIKDYPGSKGGNGVYQRIINKIPDAKKIFIPFLGSGQIFRRLDHARAEIVGNDVDRHIFNVWHDAGIKIGNWYWKSVFSNAYSSSVDSQKTSDHKEMVEWFKSDDALPVSISIFRICASRRGLPWR